MTLLINALASLGLTMIVNAAMLLPDGPPCIGSQPPSISEMAPCPQLRPDPHK